VSSLDQLNGIPCDGGTGTTQVSYGSGGAVSLTCNVSAPPSTLTADPDNTCASPVDFGTLSGSDTLADTGVNVGDSPAWYAITIPSSVSSFTVTVAGTVVGSAAAGSDVMDVDTNCAPTTVSGGSNVTSYTGSTPGTYYILVTEGSSGADGGFTLTVTGTS
jgi:hypothetical protein